MAVPNIIVSLSGTSFPIPQVGSTPWGQNVTNWIVAASGANGFVQIGGGSQPLLADLNFGANFGLISIYFKSRSANIAGSGVLRLANADIIAFRNHGNTFDDSLGVDANDNLSWSNNATGTPVVTILTGNPYLEANISSQSIATATSTLVIYTTKVTDTDTAYGTGTGLFTVPAGKGGIYAVSAQCSFATTWTAAITEVSIFINKNGGAVAQERNGAYDMAVGSVIVKNTSALINCAAGDTLSINIYHTNGVARSLDGTTNNRLTIKRVA